PPYSVPTKLDWSATVPVAALSRLVTSETLALQSSRQSAISSLVTQRDQRVDFRRAPRRDVASHKRYEAQQQRHPHKRQRVGGCDTIQKADESARRGDRDQKSKCQSSCDNEQAFAQHKSQYIPFLRAQRHSNTHLPRALGAKERDV